MTHPIHIGIGGWTFEPWRGVFYPDGLTQKRELEFASRALTSIEINGTYYSTFKPDSWMKWRDETPDGFVFSVKASRYCTNRKVLSDGKESFDRFLDQGLTLLGPKLGPINWQFMATKKFDPEDFEGFLKILPHEKDGLRLRHALEVRHGSFDVPQFYDLAAKYGMAIVYANYCGVEGDLTYAGGSLIVGADGEVLAQAGMGPVLLIADLPQVEAGRLSSQAQDFRDIALP